MTDIRGLMAMTGRVALITGASGHVGAVAAETFHDLGADIVVSDRDADLCRATADRLSGGPTEVLGVACDLESETARRDLVEHAAGWRRRLDLIVNCAAFVGTSELDGWVGDFEDQTTETWRRALEVNVTAPFSLVRYAAPYLRSAERGGVVINVSSIYGSVGPDNRLYEGLFMANPAAYAASKGALDQLTRWLATTLAPKVRVNGIAPGGIEREQPEAFRRRYSARTPMQRMATEDDLRGAFAFLGTDLSAYVTGQVVLVDGGWTAW